MARDQNRTCVTAVMLGRIAKRIIAAKVMADTMIQGVALNTPRTMVMKVVEILETAIPDILSKITLQLNTFEGLVASNVSNRTAGRRDIEAMWLKVCKAIGLGSSGTSRCGLPYPYRVHHGLTVLGS